MYKTTSYFIFRNLDFLNSLGQEVIPPHAHYRTPSPYLPFTLKYFDIYFICSQKVNYIVLLILLLIKVIIILTTCDNIIYYKFWYYLINNYLGINHSTQPIKIILTNLESTPTILII